MQKYFYTETNINVPAVTTKQMIEIDRIAIEEIGPNLYQMMENAGRNLTLALPKTGLSEKKCGQLLLGDIGIPKIVYDKIGMEYNSPFKNRFVVKLNYK